MLGTCDIVAFVPTVKPEIARDFYENKLGLQFISNDGFASVFDANGTMIRLATVKEFTPHPFTILGWHVSDIVSAIKNLMDKGITFQIYGFFPQDELGICTFSNGAKVAWFKDPDGNTLSLTQFEG